MATSKKAAAKDVVDLKDLKAIAEGAVAGAVKELKDVPRFFPNGVELIHVKVEALTVLVEVKIAGKAAPQILLAEDGGFQPE